MYIRKTVRRYKDKTYVNFLLVESVLTDKGPRQKVICSLGDLSPRPPEQWLALARKLQDALTGQLALPGLADDDLELQQLQQALPLPAVPPADVATTAATTPSADDLVAVHIDRVTYEAPRPAGHVHVGRQFWNRLGLDDIFKSLGFSPYLVSLTCAMTLNRLIHPAAEYEGTGIGLTIVRKAVERMGGRVNFESEPGQGTTFWLELRKTDAS